MLGWKLFARAVTLLIENLGDAIRVSAVPYAVIIAVTFWLQAELPPPGAEVTSLEFSPDLLLIPLVTIAVSLWIAVAWHRFALLEEYPQGWIPPMHGGEILGYLGRSILIGLLVGVVVVVVSIPLGILTVAFPQPLGATIVAAGGLFVSMILFYRLAVVLPARAIGRSMTFGEAMEATRGHSGTVVVLALLTAGFSVLLEIPTLIEGSAGAISVIYQGVVGWIALMVGVSTLTSLYGHLVEGRPVD